MVIWREKDSWVKEDHGQVPKKDGREILQLFRNTDQDLIKTTT